MEMVRLEIQHYVTTASNLQNKLNRSKATLRNPQINQASSPYLKTVFQEYKENGRQLCISLQQKTDISADAKAQGGSTLDQNYFHVLSKDSPQGSSEKRNLGLTSKTLTMVYIIYHM